MTTDSLNDWSTTPASNTDIAGTDINVGCAPQDVGVFMRTVMSQIAYAVQGSGGAIPETWYADDIRAATGTISTTLDILSSGSSGDQAVTFAAFNPTVANPGYTLSPGGKLEQWGSTVVMTDGSGNATVTFPTPFSTFLTVVAVNGDATITQISPQVFGNSTTTFTFVVPGFPSQNYRVNWIAIGTD